MELFASESHFSYMAAYSKKPWKFVNKTIKSNFSLTGTYRTSFWCQGSYVKGDICQNRSHNFKFLGKKPSIGKPYIFL